MGMTALMAAEPDSAIEEESIVMRSIHGCPKICK
jgi:hypothetical protein